MGFTASPVQPRAVLCIRLLPSGGKSPGSTWIWKNHLVQPPLLPVWLPAAMAGNPQLPSQARGCAPGAPSPSHTPGAGFRAHSQLRWGCRHWDSMGGWGLLFSVFPFLSFFLSSVFFFFSSHINCVSDLVCQELNQSHAEQRGGALGSRGRAGSRQGRLRAELAAPSPPRRWLRRRSRVWRELGPCTPSSKALGVSCHWPPLQSLLTPRLLECFWPQLC